MSSFLGKSRFYENFSHLKSLFVLLAKQKNAWRSRYVVPRRKFYSSHVRAVIDRDTMEWTTKFPRSKPCKRFLLYLSLAGFVCGFSLLNPSVAYFREDEENSVCGNSGRHKGFSGQSLRMWKAGSCKAQILETRVDFLETRSESFQKQVRWPHYFILRLGSVD